MGKQAFAGQRVDVFRVDPDSVKIIEDPAHPLYDERIHLPLEESRVQSVIEFGVREPVLVRKGPDGSAEVVAGRQRVRWAREANQRLLAEGKEPLTIPILPQRAEDVVLFAVSIIENEMRTQDSPLCRARKMAAAQDRGFDVESVAKLFGVKASAVKAHLAMLEAPKPVQRAVEAGKLSVSAAVKAAKLDGDELDAFLADQGDKPATVEKVARKIREKNGETSAPGKKEIRAEMERMEQFKDDVEAVAMADAFRWVLTGERFGAMKSDP